MAKRGNTNKARLNRRWRDIDDALAGVGDLHVWSAGKDIADIEGELLQELDAIEYQLSQDLYDRA